MEKNHTVLKFWEITKIIGPYPPVCMYVQCAAIIESRMTGCKSLVVDCEFGIRLNGVKTKPIERTASQLSNDMKID